MEGALVELARAAAAAARADREAQALPPAPEKKYRGVRTRGHCRSGAEIRVTAANSQRVWLGSYDTAEEAAYAYDAAARVLQGERAKLNFPDRIPAGEEVKAAVALARIAEVERRAMRARAAAKTPVVSACQAALPVPPPPPPPQPAPAPARGASTSGVAPAPHGIKLEQETAPPQAAVSLRAAAPAAPAATPQTPASLAYRCAAPAPAPMPRPPVVFPYLRAPAPHLFPYRPASALGPAGHYFYRPPPAEAATSAATVHHEAARGGAGLQ
ncbi:hypothetical protein ACP70R_043390 [Stipagrostis hirtigluma subsp. patula]